jgi:hypothetical protein
METQDFNALFESKFQELLLLANESEITSEFSAGLQAVLNETEQALDMAMTQEELEAVKVRINPLRRMLQAQEAFLLNLREKALAECWPDEKPAGEATTN